MNDIKSRKGQPFAFNANIDWQSAAPGIRRKVMSYNDKMMIVCVEFEVGAIGKMHHHPHYQCSYIGSGVFDVEINGKKERLQKGDTFIVDSDIEHEAVCVEAGTLIDIFTPMREDFI